MNVKTRRWLVVYGIVAHGLSALLYWQNADLRATADGSAQFAAEQAGALCESGCRYHALMVEHLVQAAQVAESTLHLAGDSIVAQLPAGSFGERALNLGIRGDLAVGLTYRISRYPFIHPGHRTIVYIGINDVLRGEDGRTVGTIREMVEALASRGVMVVLSALLPVDEQALGRPINARVRELNAEMAKFCAAIANCRFADAGRMMTDGTGQLWATLHTDDGVHLSADGYKIFVRVLREALVRASSD